MMRVHDRIRGRSGAFERTMGAIKLLAGHRMNRHVNVTVDLIIIEHIG